jgi:hypothetical protein
MVGKRAAVLASIGSLASGSLRASSGTAQAIASKVKPSRLHYVSGATRNALYPSLIPDPGIELMHIADSRVGVV